MLRDNEVLLQELRSDVDNPHGSLRMGMLFGIGLAAAVYEGRERIYARGHAVENIAARRDRLLASLTLIASIGVIVGLPFALRAGAEFFLPVTAALVVAIALVPMLEWFERQGVPSKLASVLCVVIFLTIMAFAVGSIVIPAMDWVVQVPERIGRVQTALAPVLDLYKSLDKYIDRIFSQIAISGSHAREVRLESPNSLMGLITTSAPHAAIQLFFALLVVFFFLSGWTRMAVCPKIL